ncbi:MAG TPA: MurR/RpiR family transcriptional regulator [Nocardioides sp.]|jgi:DNA-binding MurR/RpiR family transcriptional regulator|uniref:MurR/RpiR family transcriptional regulator n=1 Tax=Nocardioides sp. TaxID=35761 RepID=UPI002E3273CE|nr:MurR/RpiR family transcriptional regulator [Nocardioides sp.]HEX3929358.1 MurR/RpiR family transcriptional regulator [Nocardioides sp.]
MSEGPASSLGVTERVRRSLGQLSKSERKVARALLSGPPTTGLESVSQLAARADVSGPTVSRFVTRLGFDNYAAFRQALRDDLSARVLSPVEVYRSHDLASSDRTPLGLAADALAQAVTGTLAQLSPPDFERAAALLAAERHRVLVTGGWTSHLLAAMLTSLVRPFRSGVHHVPSLAAERAAALADLRRGDVVVVFDFRRYELDTFEFARLARDRGGHLVLVTDPWLSPIADLADAVLPAQVDGPSPFESLTPTVAVVETLATDVARRLGAAGNARLDRYGSIADQWVRPFGGSGPDGDA